jgi:hypothetical protein
MKAYGTPTPELAWQKARCAGGECVEVATHRGMIFVRDSKDPNGGVLRYSVGEWRSFVQGIKAGEFDSLGARPAS